jgi:hypothetical protein
VAILYRSLDSRLIFQIICLFRVRVRMDINSNNNNNSSRVHHRPLHPCFRQSLHHQSPRRCSSTTPTRIRCISPFRCRLTCLRRRLAIDLLQARLVSSSRKESSRATRKSLNSRYLQLCRSLLHCLHQPFFPHPRRVREVKLLVQTGGRI